VASGKMENGKWPGLSGTKDGKIAAWHAFQLKKWPTSDSSLNGCPFWLPGSFAPFLLSLFAKYHGHNFVWQANVSVGSREGQHT